MRCRCHHRLVVTVTVTVANTSRWYVAACIGGRVKIEVVVISRVFFLKKERENIGVQVGGGGQIERVLADTWRWIC